MTNKRMGKSFAQILEGSLQSNASLVMIPASQIKPCRYQPRQKIDEASLEDLKQSIKAKGILQPIIVRPLAHGVYELVAGERRWRAACAIGIGELPSVVRAFSDREVLECSLIENLQREGLDAIEEAKGYARLIEEFGYSQEQIAEQVGKDRSTIANALRLLKLPKEAQDALRAQRIRPGHAKALLAVEDTARQLELLRKAVTEQLSVRQLEAMASSIAPSRRGRRGRLGAVSPHLQKIEAALRVALGTKVRVTSRRHGGRILVEYFSDEDLLRIAKAMGAAIAEDPE